MIIKNQRNGEKLIIMPNGRLDKTTAPLLQAFIDENDGGTNNIIIDMQNIEDISSSGLRVLLYIHKKMSKIGTLLLINVCLEIMEIFEMTGFSDVLNIE